MARIRNVTNRLIIIGPGGPGNRNESWLAPGIEFVMPPNAGANPALDKVVFNDDLGKSVALAALIDSHEVLVVNPYEEPLGSTGVAGYGGFSESDNGITDAIKAWIKSGDALIQFFEINGPSTDNSYSGVKEGTLIRVAVTNGIGVLDTFNSTATVEVAIIGGTAPAPKINGADGPVLLTMTNGSVEATISADAAGDVLLGLQNGNTTLDLSDTATVSLS